MEKEELEMIVSSNKNSFATFKEGAIKELVLNNCKIINYNPEETNSLKQGCYLMYPWVGRLNNEKKLKELMKIKDDEILEIPFRDDNNYPIHGLYTGKRKIIIKKTEESITFSPENENENFPKLKETYIIKDKELIINTYLTNESNENQYFYYGYHPYITINNKQISPFIIKTNCNKHYIPQKDLVPSLTNEGIYLTEKKSLNNNVLTDMYLDDFYECNESDSTAYFEITDPETNISIKIEDGDYSSFTDFKIFKYRFMQIYTPDSRSCLCIEPLTAPINSFNVDFINNTLFLSPFQKAISSFRILFN